MWKQSFTFYVLLLALPNIALGLWLSAYPQTLLPAFLPDHAASAEPIAGASQTEAAPPPVTAELKYIARLAGLGLFMVSMLLFTARRQPGQNRELMFWMSLYYAGLAALNIAAVAFGEIDLWTLPAGIFWLVAAGFLMAFASRYLLVRE